MAKTPPILPGPLSIGPPEWPVAGQTFQYLFNLLSFMHDTATYGDLVTVSVKPALVYLVNHPDLVQEVFVTNHQRVGRGRTTETLQYLVGYGYGLVTSDGPLHLHQRRLMQPQFHHRRIAGYAETMTEFSHRHMEAWGRQGAD